MAINTPILNQASKNIFSTPLEKIKQGKLALEKKNHKKGWIYLTLTILLIVPYSVFFLYPQTQRFLSFETELSKIQSEISNYESTLADLEKTREIHKSAYDKTFEEQQKVIDIVFPKTPEKLAIIQLLENFATRLSSAYPPFEFTSITFQPSVEKEGYNVLPFQTTIHASRKNFDRFLALIELSGNYDPKNPDHIRLMEISNISLRYRGADKTGKDQGVDFTVQLNAYSQ